MPALESLSSLGFGPWRFLKSLCKKKVRAHFSFPLKVDERWAFVDVLEMGPKVDKTWYSLRGGALPLENKGEAAPHVKNLGLHSGPLHSLPIKGSAPPPPPPPFPSPNPVAQKSIHHHCGMSQSKKSYDVYHFLVYTIDPERVFHHSRAVYYSLALGWPIVCKSFRARVSYADLRVFALPCWSARSLRKLSIKNLPRECCWI